MDWEQDEYYRQKVARIIKDRKEILKEALDFVNSLPKYPIIPQPPPKKKANWRVVFVGGFVILIISWTIVYFFVLGNR